ncbi:GAP family protein [Nocardia spumae]|uniref:GAP family protein n=1 Tax=Nocardia spumae TaxID=2887190 RepID=UPI001D1335FD|nr:GAP family protein [Nocardia spumae]
MGDLLVLLIPEIIGLIITPGAIVGCVLLLQSSRPTANSCAFGGAFLLVYTQIAIAALLGGAGDPQSTSKDTSHWAGLAVGLLFLACGVWIAIRKPRSRHAAPRWVGELENVGPRGAFIMGLGLAVINPNLFIMMSGMSLISSSGVSVSMAILATVVLLISAILDFVIPIGIFLLLGERARTGLDAAKTWMIGHTRVLSLGVMFGFGALFTIRGIVNLA